MTAPLPVYEKDHIEECTSVILKERRDSKVLMEETKELCHRLWQEKQSRKTTAIITRTQVRKTMLQSPTKNIWKDGAMVLTLTRHENFIAGQCLEGGRTGSTKRWFRIRDYGNQMVCRQRMKMLTILCFVALFCIY